MRRYSVSELSDKLITHGRTFLDPRDDTLYINWTCSTVEFTFRGTHLNVTLRAGCGYEFEGLPGDPNAPKRATWPYLAVFLDDIPMPLRKFEIASPYETWLLIQSPEVQTHRIRIMKLTENNKTFLGVTAFTAEGEFLHMERANKPHVEFVGDSITCGYGNLIKDPARHFYSVDEHGYLAYGPTAARTLGFDWSCVSVSGITAVHHEGWQIGYAMEEIYAYTDRIGQERLGMAPELWDFAGHPADYVVVNLGTNDCYGIQFSPDPEELSRFPGAYLAFIETIRRLNGPRTHIVCSLGSMNYYLWHDIVTVMEQYKKDTGDERLHLLRFRPMHPLDGAGADGHPSLDTHQKMAEELAALLRTLE